MRSYIKLFCCCLAFLTTSCAEIVVKRVDYAAPIHMQDDARPAPIRFNKLRFMLPPGTEIGLESGMGPVLLGGLCSGTYPVSRNILNRKFDQQYLESAFENALGSQGYDVTNNIDMDFDYDDEQSRANYVITARVKDVDLDLCKRGRFTGLNIFNSAEGTKGKLYARIDWSVYNALTRSVAYKTTTEGYSRRDYPNAEGLELLFLDAFEMAAHNLGADQSFYDLIVRGKKPEKSANKPTGFNASNSPYNWDDPIHLPHRALYTMPFNQQADRLRHAAVTIQKRGHGSGFFISQQGHILTNAHVVGNAQHVRVILADKKTTRIASVLRIDKSQDVALLKLDDANDINIITLPIKTSKPAVGTDIYTIGAPLDYSRMENTISKGIISNHRRLKTAGIKQTYIQGDITLHPGNSGGPLLDEFGNIIGMSVAIFNPTSSAENSGDLSLFIPIETALSAMNITTDE